MTKPSTRDSSGPPPQTTNVRSAGSRDVARWRVRHPSAWSCKQLDPRRIEHYARVHQAQQLPENILRHAVSHHDRDALLGRITGLLDEELLVGDQPLAERLVRPVEHFADQPIQGRASDCTGDRATGSAGSGANPTGPTNSNGRSADSCNAT